MFNVRDFVIKMPNCVGKAHKHENAYMMHMLSMRVKIRKKNI